MSAVGTDVNPPSRFVSLATIGLVLTLPLMGCGDYDPEAPAAAGGSTGQTMATGQLEPVGPTASGGAAGGGGQTATGGSGSLAPGGTGGTGGGTLEVAPVEADCAAIEPCGGSVVGTWVVAGSCLPVSGNADVAGFGLGCTAAPVTGALEVVGSWTANADGTFTDQTTTTGDSQIELPAECLNVSGTVTTCDRLGGALQALGYASATCEDAASGGGCTCLASAEQAGGLAMVTVGAASSGTYTTANGVLTTSAGTNNAYSYCVTGNTLVLTPQPTGATGTLTGTIVLVKP
jgi:hypothetical protein